MARRALPGLPRRSGICPVWRNSHRVGRRSKYSALAMNETGRGLLSARKIESMNERWLATTIAGPSEGRCSRPCTSKGKSRRSGAPRATFRMR